MTTDLRPAPGRTEQKGKAAIAVWPLSSTQSGRLSLAEPRPKTFTTDKAPDAAFERTLERAQSGDQAALGLLFTQFNPSIYRYLSCRTGDSELAKDLTADVFVRVLEAVAAGHTWHESFTGWLYRIAQNRLIDHVRAAKRRPQCSLPDNVSYLDSPVVDETLDRQQRVREVRMVINQLQPKHAQVLQLRFAENLSQADIGQRLGKSEGSVKVMQHRALKVLRTKLHERPSLRTIA